VDKRPTAGRTAGFLAPGRPRLPGGLRLPGRLRLPGHSADPLFRNAYLLMINTGTTGLLGLAFWLLAARHYATADVGRATAAYSAMNLLAGLTAFSLTGALARFIPQSGQRTGRLIAGGYAITTVASTGLAIGFLATVGHSGSSYSELGSLTAGIAFTASVVAWGIFTLQDIVLIGLRSAHWVAIENGAFGIAKIALLVAFATVIPHLGLFAAWMLPVAVALPLINLLIFRRLMPRHVGLAGDRPPPTGRQIGRFLAGDVTGSLCMLATGNVIPVAVAVLVSPGTNAFFYMAWTVGTTVDLLAVNMATSLTVEGAFNATTLAVNCRAALRRTMVVLLPIVAVMALAAPRILGLFGPGYAAHGAPILELLVVATIPKTATELYLGALRAQSRTSLIAIVQAARAVLMIGLALLLTAEMGTVGTGLAVLAGQLITAIAILPGLRRILVTGRPRPAAPAVPAMARSGGSAA
jgi:O-antigen/teichoic acid export membrane protein